MGSRVEIAGARAVKIDPASMLVAECHFSADGLERGCAAKVFFRAVPLVTFDDRHSVCARRDRDRDFVATTNVDGHDLGVGRRIIELDDGIPHVRHDLQARGRRSRIYGTIDRDAAAFRKWDLDVSVRNPCAALHVAPHGNDVS